MATVNFQCGHCGKLMAVGTEHLGQQVRCPHCQQVVLVPISAAPLPVPEPAPSPPAAAQTPAAGPAGWAGERLFLPSHEDPEDIFTPPEETDDLFGASDAPRIEMPAEPPPAPEFTPAVATASPSAEPPGPAASLW